MDRTEQLKNDTERTILLSKNVTEQSILLYDRFFENKWSKFFFLKDCKKGQNGSFMNDEQTKLKKSTYQSLIFRFLDTWFFKIWIPGYLDTCISRFLSRYLNTCGFLDILISGYVDTWIQGYLYTWISKNQDTWIPVYLDTWIPGYLDTRIPVYMDI